MKPVVTFERSTVRTPFQIGCSKTPWAWARLSCSGRVQSLENVKAFDHRSCWRWRGPHLSASQCGDQLRNLPFGASADRRWIRKWESHMQHKHPSVAGFASKRIPTPSCEPLGGPRQFLRNVSTRCQHGMVSQDQRTSFALSPGSKPEAPEARLECLSLAASPEKHQRLPV